MDINKNPDFDYIDGVENNDEETFFSDHYIEENDAPGIDDEVHLIGGQALNEDTFDGSAPEAYVMDVDSDNTFDFYIAEENYDGIVDLDNAMDDYMEMDSYAEDLDVEPFVMDVDSDVTHDFDVAIENGDGVVGSDEFYDVNDIYSLNDLPEDIKGNIIGYEPEAEVPEAEVPDVPEIDDPTPEIDDPTPEIDDPTPDIPDLYPENVEPDIFPDDIDFM